MEESRLRFGGVMEADDVQEVTGERVQAATIHRV